MHVTTGEIVAASGDFGQAERELTAAITIAEDHRLPHQIQRAARASARLPATARLARQALTKLLPAEAGTSDS